MDQLSAAVDEAADGPSLARALLRVGPGGAARIVGGAVFDLIRGGLTNEAEMVRQSTSTR
jgi:hypothetical protein